MTTAGTLLNGFWQWLDHVAQAVLAARTRFTRRRQVRLIETDDGAFAVAASGKRPDGVPAGARLHIDNGAIAARSNPQLQSALQGGDIELVLRPDRFVFKPLELPARAAEFLDGVVRSQIDRLTPWDADHAAFGAGRPADAGGGRIVVTVAATATEALLPLVTALTAAGADAITVETPAPDEGAGAPAIIVMTRNIARMLDLGAMRRILLVGLAFVGLLAATAMMAAAIIDSNLESRQDELARQIAQRRAAALSLRNAPGDPKTVAERALAARKNQSPSAVIALEILSQILPDDTYVTELRIEPGRLRLSGITHDAPRLIRLIEQTHHFRQATFFAPITRSPSDTGDRFYIEARMVPNFSLTP
jgi:general secretion pathway protein L